MGTVLGVGHIDYAVLKQLAKDIRRDSGQAFRVTDLLAMAPQNDPFYCGTEKDLTQGAWFRAVWERCWPPPVNGTPYSLRDPFRSAMPGR